MVLVLQGPRPVEHHIDGGCPAFPPNGDSQEVERRRSRIRRPLDGGTASGTPFFLSCPTGAKRAFLPVVCFRKIITIQRLQMFLFRPTPKATGVIREWVEEGGAVIVKERMRLDLKRLRHIEFP